MFSIVLTRRAATRARNLALWCGLIALALGNMLLGLSDHGIINGNESLYVESAREMLRTGNLIIPTLNGLPYLEKPPLFSWMLAAVSHIGGISEIGARLVPVTASLLVAVALARFSLLLRIGGAPWMAPYVYLTSLGVVTMSSVAMPDALLNSLFGIGCLAYAAALKLRSGKFARLTALFLGLACLTKGLLPLALFGLATSIYVAVKRESLKVVLGFGRDYLVWVLLLAPLLAWLAAAEASLPGAARRFIVDEHVLRFLGLREPSDYYSGSIFYYVPRLFLFAFPWIGVLIFGWAATGRRKIDEERNTRLFLWACIWAPFVFFSLSQAKANYYVTICLPPLALLSADYMRVLLRRKRGNWLTLSIIVPTLVLLLIFALRSWAIATGRTSPLLGRSDGSFPLTMAALLTLCIVLVGLVQFNKRKTAALGIGMLIVPLTLQLHHLLAIADPLISAREMAAYIKSGFAGAPIFLYQDYEAFGALPVYLDRNIPVIDSASNDLYFGRKLLPNHENLIDEDSALDQEEALIVVLSDREKSLRQSGLHSRIEKVGEIGRASLYRLRDASPVDR